MDDLKDSKVKSKYGNVLSVEVESYFNVRVHLELFYVPYHLTLDLINERRHRDRNQET